MASLRAQAKEADSLGPSSAPCAVLEDLEGEVQILDPARTHLLPTKSKSVVPCGSWVSVRSGWAVLKHRQRFELRLGSDTFVEVFDHDSGDSRDSGKGSSPQDYVILYNGKVLVDSGAAEQFRLITPNGRVRLDLGIALVMYDRTQQETQLVALDGKSSLENRFESSRVIEVDQGEATSLDLLADRVVPSTPRAIEVASLKTQLGDLPLSKKRLGAFVQVAVHRQKRKFPAVLVNSKTVMDRKIASVPDPNEEVEDNTPGESPRRYERHASQPDDKKAYDQWVNKIVGGDAEGKQTLYPKETGRKPQSISEPVAAELSSKRKQAFAKEKENILKHLTELREDD